MARWSERLGDWDDLGEEDLTSPALSAGKRSLTMTPGRDRSTIPGKVALTQRLPSGFLQRAAAQAGPGALRLPTALPASAAGAPLPVDLAGRFGASLRADLGAVRVHTGAEADLAAEGVGARAFAVGQDIYFRAGEYQPDSEAGQHLIAHEVAHTVQQGGGALAVQAALTVSQAEDPLEREADDAARAMVHSKLAPPLSRATVHVARLQEDPEHASYGSYGTTPTVSMDARTYVSTHSAKIIPYTGAQLYLASFDMPEVYARWTDGDSKKFVAAMWTPIADAYVTNNTYFFLFQAVQPDSIIDAINTGRDCAPNPNGTADWRQAVVTELRRVFARRIIEALARIVPRWARVKNQLLLRKETGDTAADRAPTVDEVAPSHPIDKHVIAALGQTAELDPILYRSMNRSEGVVHAIEKLTPINSYRFCEEEGSGRERYIRVLDPPNATREQVALTLTGTANNAYQVEDYAPIFRVPAHLYTDKVRQEWIAHGGNPQSMGGSISESFRDERNLNAARDVAPTENLAASEDGKKLILDRIGLIVRHMEALGNEIAGGDASVLAVLRDQILRRARFMRDHTPAEVVKWDGQTQAQYDIIERAVRGAQLAKEKGKPFKDWKVADDVVSRTLRNFYLAALSSETHTTGREKIQFAEEQLALMGINVIDLLMADLRRVLIEARKNRGAGQVTAFGFTQGDGGPFLSKAEGAKLEKEEDTLRLRLVELREAMLQDPARGQVLFAALAKEVTEFSAGVEMVGDFDQMDYAWQVLYDGIRGVGAWSGTNVDRVKYANKVTDLANVWGGIYATWKKDRAAGKAALDANRDKLTKLMSDIRGFLEDAATIDKWVGFALMIGIAIMTMGVGVYVEAAVGAGTLAGFAAATVAEAAVFTSLSHALLADPNAPPGAILHEFGHNILMFGALKVISMVYIGWVGEAAAGTLKGQAGLILTQFVALNGYALYDADRIKREKTGKGLTGDEIGEISLMNFLMIAAMVAGAKLAKRGLESLRLQGEYANANAKLMGVKTRMVALTEEMAAGSRSVDKAKELVSRQRELLDAEAEVIARLDKIVAEGKAGAAGLDIAEYNTLKAEHNTAMSELVRSEVIINLEPAGPNTMMCAPGDPFVQAMDYYAKQPGTTVQPLATDPVTGAKAFEVRPPEVAPPGGGPKQPGTPFRVIERTSATGRVARAPEVDARVPANEAEALARHQYAEEARRLTGERDQALETAVEGIESPEFSVIDVGGGFSNVVARASGGSRAAPEAGGGLPERITISAGPERWSTYGKRPVGQTAGEVNAPGVEVSRGTTDQHGYVAADVMADAIAIGRYETGIATFKGKVEGPIEAKSGHKPGDPAWPSSKPLRVKVGNKYFYGDQINLTTGAGPAEQAPAGWFRSAAERDAMVGDGTIVYGDAHLAAMKAGATKVVVSGGSGTAAWNAEAAAEAGAKVTWVGRRSKPKEGTEEAEELNRIKAELREEGLDPGRKKELLDRQRDIEAFRKAALRRNTDPEYSAFKNPNIERVGGNITKIERLPGGRARVHIEGRDPIEVDQVVISHGQNPAGKGGLDGIVKGMEFKMIRTASGRLVGLESVEPPGAVKLLGAAFAEARLKKHVVESERADFERLIEEQAAALPQNSRGVAPGFAMAADTITAANNVLMAREFQLTGKHGPLVLKTGEEGHWPADVAIYVARELGVEPARVRVDVLGGGRSGDWVFKVRLGEEDLGILKVFKDTQSAQTELNMIKELGSHVLDKSKPVGARSGMIEVGGAGKTRGAVMMETAKGESVASMVEHLPESGIFREQALAKLEKAVEDVARGLAELHNSTGTGEPMDLANKQSDANYILGKLTQVEPVLGTDAILIRQALEGEVIPAFYESTVPASAYHGDANLGNFMISTNSAGKSTVGIIDVGTMQYSVSPTGQGTKTGAGDVARFLGSFETMYTPVKLSTGELAQIRAAFERVYFAEVGGNKADYEAGIKLYRVELEIAALNKGAPVADVVARIRTVLGL